LQQTPSFFDAGSALKASLGTANPNVQLIMAANKADLLNGYRPDGLQQIAVADLEQCAAALDAPLYLTSAKTGQVVETLFRHLGQLLAGQ
jgi:hypothetical protein